MFVVGLCAHSASIPALSSSVVIARAPSRGAVGRARASRALLVSGAPARAHACAVALPRGNTREGHASTRRDLEGMRANDRPRGSRRATPFLTCWLSISSGFSMWRDVARRATSHSASPKAALWKFGPVSLNARARKNSPMVMRVSWWRSEKREAICRKDGTSTPRERGSLVGWWGWG
jgi:hypothetical protein